MNRVIQHVLIPQKHILVGVYILLFCLPVLANKSVYKYINQERVGSASVEVLEDPLKEKLLSTIQEGEWAKTTKQTLNFGFYQGAVWLRVTEIPFSGILELKNSNLDRISIFKKINNRYELIEETGDIYPFNQRPVIHRFFHLPVSTSDSLILRIENYGDQLFIPLKVYSPKGLERRDYTEQFVNGIYYGLCLFALIFNLFIYLKIREKATLFYILYLFNLLVLQLALSGYGYEYLWNDSSYIATHAPPFFATTSVFCLILFTQEFLQTKKRLPLSNKLFTWIASVLGVNIVLALFAQTYSTSILVINGLTLVLNLIILPVAVLALRRNFKPARFFFFAFFVLILSVFAFILRNFGLVPSNFLTEYSLQIGSSLEVLLLTFAIVDKFKSFKDEAVLQLEKNNELQLQQNVRLEEEVKERTQEIVLQKEKLEVKNKEVTDSINYAKRIQSALIPSIVKFRSAFKGAFVMWEPKDILSGDFYWLSQTVTTKADGENSKLTVFCLGDCTGHGVPGAILSVLGLKILNLSLKIKDVNSPADALNYLHLQFNSTFNSAVENEGVDPIRDGMVISFCAYDHEKEMVYFSGARQSLYHVTNGNLIEYKGDKQSIGAQSVIESYTIHEIPVKSGDLIYLSSDGYPDQFGGESDKKYKYRPFKEFLLKNHTRAMDEQLRALQDEFNQWRGDREQTDDVCVIGIQI